MPEFSYVARDNSGQRVTGTVSAAGRREAMSALAGQSLFPLQLDSSDTSPEPTRVRRVPARTLAASYSLLADLLRSGVPLLRALDVLRNQSSHKGLQQVLGEVHDRVEDGATLAEAMGPFQRIFGEMAVSMIRAGGEGGFLEEALTRVAEFTEAQEDFKKRTLGAIAYPAILAVIGTVIVTLLLIFFVPKFDELFTRLRERGELPVLTDWMLWFSAVLRRWGLILLVVAAGVVWFTRRWLLGEAGRVWWDRTRIRVPLAGQIFLHLAVARFCRVLGTLLRNGVPLLRSLEIASGTMGNRVLAATIDEAREEVSGGMSLAKPLARSGRFPAEVVEMIGVAEQSNTLEKVLLEIADSLERRTWRQLDLGVRLLEPVLLLILAGAVLVVFLALLLPVLRMSEAI